MNSRRIYKIYKSKPTIEGAGVHLKRGFGFSHVPLFDPFLMLDDFHTSNPAEYLPGFPWHPHRGIETITYIIEGLVEHGDSMGNKGVIGAGDVQWMTAGSGIIHQEMPKKSPTGTMWGFQFWANLPASHKMMPPRYRDVKSADIPEVSLAPGVKVKIVSGEIKGVKGPVRDIIIDPELLDITVTASKAFAHSVKSGRTLFVYVIKGEGFFGEHQERPSGNKASELHGPETVILYNHEGNDLNITAGKEPLRFILLSGKPLGEPVAWEGPIVMNTQEELRIAFEEYQNGTFIKTR
jgi:quercetin 2,3-dioxygenase